MVGPFPRLTMSRPKKPSKRKLGGVQLAIFELIWSSFKWITRIFVKEAGDKTMTIYLQTSQQPSVEDWEDCQRMLQEILDAAFKDTYDRYNMAYGRKRPKDGPYIEIMSPAIFKMIATEVAPHRLSAGR